MSEKLDKLRASLEKEKERRIKINNRIESLERRIQEAEAAEVNEMVVDLDAPLLLFFQRSTQLIEFFAHTFLQSF